MKTYWKATDSEGRSFGAPEVVWRVGRIVRDPKPAGSMICEAGLLHAATVPTQSLVTHAAITWPFRLFEVEPRAAVVTDPEHPHKVGCRAWKVAREVEAWQALGPQGAEVLSLVERAGRLTDEEARQLHVARNAARDVAWYVAWYVARNAAWNAAWYAAWNAARNAARDAAWNAAWNVARDVARDAACALVVRDLITAERFDLLYGPWASVIGSEGS